MRRTQDAEGIGTRQPIGDMETLMIFGGTRSMCVWRVTVTVKYKVESGTCVLLTDCDEYFQITQGEGDRDRRGTGQRVLYSGGG